MLFSMSPGYCPQFDALFDNLTARETLRIFCLMRGVPLKTGAERAKKLAADLGFTNHFDKKVRLKRTIVRLRLECSNTSLFSDLALPRNQSVTNNNCNLI